MSREHAPPIKIGVPPWMMLGVRLIAVLVFLQLPWPGLDRLLVQSLARGGNVLAALCGLPLHWAVSDVTGWALELALLSVDGLSEPFLLDARVLIYRPWVVLIALSVATRSWRAARLATPAVLAWVVISIVVPVAVQRHESGRLLLPSLVNDLLFTVWGMIASPSMTYLVPALLWCAALQVTREPVLPRRAPRA